MRSARAYRDQLGKCREYQTAVVSFRFPATETRLTRQEFDRPLPRQNVPEVRREVRTHCEPFAGILRRGNRLHSARIYCKPHVEIMPAAVPLQADEVGTL